MLKSFCLSSDVGSLAEKPRSERKNWHHEEGIGPAYADKAARIGIRLGDLARPAYLEERLKEGLSRANLRLSAQDEAPVLLETLLETCARWSESLGDRIVDTLPIIRETIEAKKDLLLEGQLGVMRDLDWGIYPFVTSSNPAVGAACSGAGIPPTAIDEFWTLKPYSTAVGALPSPKASMRTRAIAGGCQSGATTGRTECG